MPRYQALLLLILLQLCFYDGKSQSPVLDDVIVTIDRDSIACKITFINDHSIFYSYQVKKRIKKTFIAKDEVRFFGGKKLEKVTFNEEDFAVHHQCDPAGNWILLNSGDTVCESLEASHHKKDVMAIKHFTIHHSGNLRTFTSCEVKHAKWGETEYFLIYPSYTYARQLKEDQVCNRQLGAYVIRDSISLMKYTTTIDEVVWTSTMVPAADVNQPSTVVPSHQFTRTKVSVEYCLQIDGIETHLPRGKAFREAICELLQNDPELVALIKEKKYNFSNLEQIIIIANSK